MLSLLLMAAAAAAQPAASVGVIFDRSVESGHFLHPDCISNRYLTKPKDRPRRAWGRRQG